ncbi:8-oxo-dGTP pyrophosphatase MutT (NUDIX family) [Agromyces flavus]|uniref:8-oxo-dGTP pyrophosphatase MutT (NUDIX family) n=1 Tax=Agromyces flavus TaxID=589382 RepID=A0A1H1ZIU8_9MICO|nr:8-oxo-dGTP pyrophosphatase MutT (NUDIX family) [Agromyces flavus]GGI46380.1 coenzyme A pyrophosphatase [Agromyces flavus]SDT33487.1 ADP-ribose pyrophosphatase YjhB, NUDIX family [Agromyces flavus]
MTPRDGASDAARTQLTALTGRPWLAERWADVREDGDEGARPAAVLILFGVLDGLPSDHEAQARAVSRDLDVLLLARATTLRSHAGQIAFPGGRVDDGDADPIDAALREAREETGLDPAGVEVLGALEAIPLSRSSHLVTPVLAWWAAPTAVAPVDHAESSAVFRIPVADLLDPGNRCTTVIRRDGMEWRGPAFTVHGAGDERLVWGFTAMVLDVLFDELGWTEPWDRSRELDLPLPPRP